MIPTKIALLTDSSADLRWEEARENNIFFVPLRILCQDGEYLDGVDIRGQDIYRRLRSGQLPHTGRRTRPYTLPQTMCIAPVPKPRTSR